MPPTQLSAFHPSPKRKRDNNPPYVPLLNTTLRHASTPPRGSPTPSGADSPRNVVADQLRGMTIAAYSAIPMSPLTPTDDVVHKKPKLESMRADSVASEDRIDSEITRSKRQEVQNCSGANSTIIRSVEDIPNTPQPQPQTKSQQQQPRILADMVAFAQPTTFQSSSPEPSARPLTSKHPSSNSKGHTSQSRSPKSPSPPPSSLTWQESEITGHLVDPSTDPDDDGTGINGIGFRPTPAIAQARKAKREQQMKDYRALQEKEARAKRMERRRRGVGGAGTNSREGSMDRSTLAKEADAARRAVVRFAI